MSEVAETVSTTLEPEGTTTGGGGPPPAESAESHRESLEAVMKTVDDKKAAEEKPAEKAQEAEVKAEKPVEAKPVEAKPVEQKQAEKPAEQEQDGKRHEAPTRFSENAKAYWRNTPREVQNEIARWERESEETKPRLERYEAIREFDEIAKTNGRDLRDSLVKINQFENMMKSNPIGALNAILQEIGPRRADGASVTLMDVAQHVVNQGQEGYQQTLRQAQVDQQRQQEQQQATEQQRAQIEQNKHLIKLAYIEPFRAANPRYDELENHIAMVLHSDMIDKSLSPPDRLAEAYKLAERMIPASNRTSGDQAQALESARRADPDLSGSKSIKSSPGLVTDEDVEERAKPGESIFESIQAEARRLKRA